MAYFVPMKIYVICENYGKIISNKGNYCKIAQFSLKIKANAK